MSRKPSRGLASKGRPLCAETARLELAYQVPPINTILAAMYLSWRTLKRVRSLDRAIVMDYHSHTTPPDEAVLRQIEREKHQRQAAMGRRIQAVNEDGTLGPVISRWLNATINPVAARLRLAAEAYLAKEYSDFASIMDSPLFGLAEMCPDGSNYLEPVLRWCLVGKSPGRDGMEVTYADDLVLAALGTLISGCASVALAHKAGLKGAPGWGLAGALSQAGDAARETALGQFITQVQGAEALLKVRSKDRSAWAQRDRLDGIAQLMVGQVKPTLEAWQERGEIDLEQVRGRTILKVMTPELKERRISLRPPQAEDWGIIGAAMREKGATDKKRPTWISFALLVLCAAQAEYGWFDLARAHPPRSGKRPGKEHRQKRWLMLSDEAHKALKGDLHRWLEMGFTHEPMVCPPEDGDYLTVKHKPVAGRPGPYGRRTDAAGTDHWRLAGEVMAGTAWTVAKDALEALKGDPGVVGGLGEGSETILGEYSRVANEPEIYFPLYLDFRGRVYPRSSWVTYQGTDLQKGLLQFPFNGNVIEKNQLDGPEWFPIVMHGAALGGLDKEPYHIRADWFWDKFWGSPAECLLHADEPVQLLTLDTLAKSLTGYDSIPCQIDGTCNGLQHLSALFGDHEAAPWVNLTGSTYDEHPSDLYGVVAERVVDRLAAMHRDPMGVEPWASRVQGFLQIDRKVCKRPVMVLPYGGTLNAVEDAVLAACAEQRPLEAPWRDCLYIDPKTGLKTVDEKAVKDGYLAFANRDLLRDHPLFKSDMRKLAGMVYEEIGKVIPKAVHAMEAFRAIAGKIGERSLEWSNNGVGSKPLWIVHAYAKSEMRSNNFRGFHLPNSVRGLAMRCDQDAVNPAAHRSGIVANFVHSMDAAHLVRTMARFKEMGGTSFGAIHDCLLGRPSEMGMLNVAVREAFMEHYRDDPLAQPVKLWDLKAQTFVGYGSWYSMATDFGVTFPERGRWKPEEVIDSAWFFS